MSLNYQQFQEVYKWLGINTAQLGCVMLPLKTIKPVIDESLLYKSPNPERFWIDGMVADKKAHCTLLFGLMAKAPNIEPHIRKVLEGWEMDDVLLEDVSYFPSPYADEKYWCLIAHIHLTKLLLEGHQRLSFLPHIDTFPEYKPHMTIAYIKDVSEEERDDIIDKLDGELRGSRIPVIGDIDLGRL
jgi:hypothetical protein